MKKISNDVPKGKGGNRRRTLPTVSTILSDSSIVELIYHPAMRETAFAVWKDEKWKTVNQICISKDNYLVPYKLVIACHIGLQMLVENALKHNKLTYKSPLTIDIETTDDQLIVCNNLQLKPKLGDSNSTGYGLESINKRYQLLSNDRVVVEHDDQHFRVTIPLLQPVDYEGRIN